LKSDVAAVVAVSHLWLVRSEIRPLKQHFEVGSVSVCLKAYDSGVDLPLR